MNIFDRAIAAVAPQTAVRRAAARKKLQILDSGYSNYGASHTKKSLAGWLYGGGSATTFGHWEMDTVYSTKKGSKALLVLTERLTRKEIIEKMPNRTAESTIKALDRIERRYGARFRKIFQTITVDNGGEFSDVESLERSAIRKGKRTQFYYCHPYSSYERGSNENLNRMIRRRHPKGTDFAKVSVAQIKKTEHWINNYPRAILGWKTSEMLFVECVAALA